MLQEAGAVDLIVSQRVPLTTRNSRGKLMEMQSGRRAIDKIYKRRHRYEIPDWQRQEVWSRSKKQNLIDTILRGWKLPKFYFLKVSDDPETYEVVDGQQRLVTIWEFLGGELPLADRTAEEFKGRYYTDLPDNVADAFSDYEIEFDAIEDASEEDVKEFFQRLQEGLPLASAEKLNSIHSKLRDFVIKHTKHRFFDKVSASDRRYGHFDILAKVAAIEIDGIEVGLRYDDLRAVFESQSEFSANSNVAKRIKSALDFVQAGFDNEAGQLLRNRTIVQSLLTLVCRLIQSPQSKGQEERVRKFFVGFLGELNKQVELGQRATDLDYLEFQRTVNANIKDGPRIRQQVLLRKLLATDPAVADMLDPTAVMESGLKGAIVDDATKIVELIGQLNERHSVQHGEDLFKATNRTAQAQANLAKVIQDFDDYKSFIDDLYFLFHESVGSRLDGRVPDSFKDVNTLRTDLQHDVDHGKKRKIKAKKKKIGEAFKKYAGTTSPAGLAPERFPVVQANLLGALKRDLGQLKV